MNEIDLNKKLDSYQAPEPSDLLKARILKAAKAEVAPQRASYAKRFMPIAASFLVIGMVGFGALQVTQKTETEASTTWQEAATDLGFEDIYNWVEAEETAAKES